MANGDELDTNPRRRLAEELRRLRLSAGLTGEELGEAIGASQPKISKIELAKQSVRVDDVDAWARTCGVDDQRRQELLKLAEDALLQASTWRREHRAGLRAKQLQAAELEGRATRIREYPPGLIPGLVQTSDYAAAVLRFADLSRQRDVAAAVAARMDRQRILYAEDTDIELLIDEAILYWRPEGSRSVLAAQLDRLIQLTSTAPMRLGIVPLGAQSAPPPVNGFVIFDLPDDEHIVLVETFAAELRHDDPRDVAIYEELFESLTNAALFGDEARELLLGHLEAVQAEDT